VDLGELCAGVAALHEGTAHERGVTVQVRVADAAQLRCDARKVKQILINLVQNALDASRAGSAVEIEVAGDGAGVRLRVLDRGAGLDPSVAARAFDAGVTTKPRGSGLGLTVARAIARQHGGELSLAPRDGGGCAAELVLPGGAA
jgi:signal transduction histidine kinase